MNREAARAIVAPFYDALNRPATKDVAALIEGAALPDWQSIGTDGSGKSRDAFVGQVKGFGKALPDLAWEIQDVFADGDTIVVRSRVSATPAVDFMGVPHGGKRFTTIAIDIHTVKDGKLARAHHVEDWLSAVKQLSAK